MLITKFPYFFSGTHYFTEAHLSLYLHIFILTVIKTNGSSVTISDWIQAYMFLLFFFFSHILRKQ